MVFFPGIFLKIRAVKNRDTKVNTKSIITNITILIDIYHFSTVYLSILYVANSIFIVNKLTTCIYYIASENNPKTNIMKNLFRLFTVLVSAAILFSACEGPMGPAGADGADGADGGR